MKRLALLIASALVLTGCSSYQHVVVYDQENQLYAEAWAPHVRHLQIYKQLEMGRTVLTLDYISIPDGYRVVIVPDPEYKGPYRVHVRGIQEKRQQN